MTAHAREGVEQGETLFNKKGSGGDTVIFSGRLHRFHWWRWGQVGNENMRDQIGGMEGEST